MKYYYIKDMALFAKGEGNRNNFIFSNGKWLPDRENWVSDRIMGYDPYEDDESPYKIGNTSIQNEIEEITEEEFEKRTRDSSGFGAGK